MKKINRISIGVGLSLLIGVFLPLAIPAQNALATFPKLVNQEIIFTAASRTTANNGTGTYSSNIITINPNGTGRAALTDHQTPDEAAVLNPVWSPDGSKIAYVCLDTLPVGALCIMNADGSNSHQIASSVAKGINEEVYLAWSPDGTEIAVLNNSEGLTIYKADDSGSRTIDISTIAGPSYIASAATMNSRVAWSSDNTLAVSVRLVNAADSSSAGVGIFTIKPDGSQATEIMRDLSVSVPYIALSWSPDSTKILTNGGPAPSGFYYDTLVAYDRSGNVLRTYNTRSMGQYNIDAVWSPDGKQIAFTAMNDSLTVPGPYNDGYQTGSKAGEQVLYVMDATSGVSSANPIALVTTSVTGHGRSIDWRGTNQVQPPVTGGGGKAQNTPLAPDTGIAPAIGATEYLHGVGLGVSVVIIFGAVVGLHRKNR